VGGVPVGGLNRAQVRGVIARQVAAEFARPVQLLVGDSSVTINPAAAGITVDEPATEQALFSSKPSSLLERIRSRSSGGRDVAPVLAFDEAKTEQVLRAELSQFALEPKNARLELPVPAPVLLAKGDASFSSMDVTARVVPGRAGAAIDIKAAVGVLHIAVIAHSTQARIYVTTIDPEMTTSQASRIDQLIGTFTTLHPCCAPRVTNIHRIAELVDGTVIAPGTKFSLNATVGRRTAARGFVRAPAIADGELVEQLGGGVSQFSTTLFNAAWFAGLPIVKHQPHSEYIARYPPGREATLDFDTIDQVISNDTDVPVIIRAATTATSVTVALYGHTGNRRVDSSTGPRRPGNGGGFSISVRRVVLDSGSIRRQDTLNWTYVGLE
jgi:vancomycin resistance protein YoaR